MQMPSYLVYCVHKTLKFGEKRGQDSVDLLHPFFWRVGVGVGVKHQCFTASPGARIFSEEFQQKTMQPIRHTEQPEKIAQLDVCEIVLFVYQTFFMPIFLIVFRKVISGSAVNAIKTNQFYISQNQNHADLFFNLSSQVHCLPLNFFNFMK